MDCVKVKKSSVVKAHSCPQYSQSFHFKLEEEMLDCSSISVIVYEVGDAVLPQSSAGKILPKCGYYARILFLKMRVICGLEV